MRSPRMGNTCALTLLATVAALTFSACSDTAEPAAEEEASATATAPTPALCMPQPSACGFPDATNTGVPPGTQLTPVNGPVTLNRPGQVFSGYEVRGQIRVLADNVTIEKTRVISGDYYSIDLAYNDAEPKGTVIRDVEIDMQGMEEGKGISFDNYTATRVHFYNGLDCAHAGNNVVITDSFCDMPKLRPGSDAHADGFQSDGGGNYVFRHNTIRNPNGQTAAILLSTNTSPISNVVIDHNLMSGGGYTVYCGTDEGGIAPNTTYTNNVISREFFRRGGYYGATTKCDRVTTHFNNVWDGNYVPPAGGGGSPGAAAPLLLVRRAKRYARAALKRELKGRFTRRLGGVKVRCKRATRTAVGCAVSWRRAKPGSGDRRYVGRVRVRRVSAGVRRYALRIRGYSSGCRCTRTLRRTGTL